jgi:transposase
MHKLEVRKVVIDLLEKKHKSVKEVGDLINISSRSIFRWKALAKKGSLQPRTNGPRRRKLDPEALRVYILKNPDHILNTMAEHFKVGKSAIWYCLKRMKITLKKRQRFIESVMQPNERNL